MIWGHSSCRNGLLAVMVYPHHHLGLPFSIESITCLPSSLVFLEAVLSRPLTSTPTVTIHIAPSGAASLH